jgi:hypothetical protein
LVLKSQTRVEKELQTAIRGKGYQWLSWHGKFTEGYEGWSKELPELVSHKVYAEEIERMDRLAERTAEAVGTRLISSNITDEYL